MDTMGAMDGMENRLFSNGPQAQRLQAGKCINTDGTYDPCP
jgi:hypothetical protein